MLVVEDNRADVFLVREAVAIYKLPVNLHVVEDGQMAIAFIDSTDQDDSAPCPKLLVLDLNVPLRSGHEILQHLRASRRCADIPVLIMTSSDSPDDRAKAAELGADVYFRKPLSYDEFVKIGEEMQRLLAAATLP